MSNIQSDLAFTALGDQQYRHYSGVSVKKFGKRWTATTVDGVSFPGYRTAHEAFGALQGLDKQFWFFEKFGDEFGFVQYGSVVHRTRPIARGDAEECFVFSLVEEKVPPKFVESTLHKRFFGAARCSGCLLPMSELRWLQLREFDNRSTTDAYLACPCGYPVWQMEMSLYSAARELLDNMARPWRRKQTLRAAGGTHNREEIAEILALQKGRCIYCNARFTDECRSTRDHFLPVARGGSDWALNIVLACRSCNSSRCNVPFRSFCRYLSTKQNVRILAHLKRRLLALEPDGLNREGLGAFCVGLALHDRSAMKDHALLRRGAVAKRLLPANATALLKRS